LIDLHTHTTASDGRCGPAELVARASAVGITTLAVTDHDTVGGCEAAAAACRADGLEFVTGIEITAVHDGIDVHVLGYFIDVASSALHAFLAEQRRRRVDRVRRMIERLSQLGIALDRDAILAPALDDPRTSAGRPWIARALVAGGHAGTTDEAFERWLGRGRSAFVPREGAEPVEVFDRIHRASGIASLAHPALIGRDEWIVEFARQGLDALEAYHGEHAAEATAHYLALAERLGLAVSGGSDYHADTHGSDLGSVTLPLDLFERLRGRRRDAIRAG
jgi:predicted metal-dependent phosphoesterase TrpH